jgi:hypothetical protein
VKIGNEEFIARAVPGAGPVGPVVKVGLQMFGMSILHRIVTPSQAREFAAELLQAANVAEGKA